jgi:hypothetical protein
MNRANLVTVGCTIAVIILVIHSIRNSGRIGIMEVIALAFTAISVTMMLIRRGRPPE